MGKNPPKATKPPTTSPSGSRRETLHDRITSILVLLQELKTNYEHLNKEVVKSNLESKEREATLNDTLAQMKAVDNSTAETVHKLSEQQKELQEKIENSNASVRLNKHEAELATMMTKTQEIETVKRAQSVQGLQIRIQWGVLVVMVVIAVYLFGMFQGSKGP